MPSTAKILAPTFNADILFPAVAMNRLAFM